MGRFFLPRVIYVPCFTAVFSKSLSNLSNRFVQSAEILWSISETWWRREARLNYKNYEENINVKVPTLCILFSQNQSSAFCLGTSFSRRFSDYRILSPAMARIFSETSVRLPHTPPPTSLSQRESFFPPRPTDPPSYWTFLCRCTRFDNPCSSLYEFLRWAEYYTTNDDNFAFREKP